MRSTALGLGLALALACEATSPTPPAPAQPPVSAPSPEPEPEPKPEPKPEPVAKALQPAPPSLCVRMCIGQQQARAVAIEVIERECAQSCESPADAACQALGNAARKRVEAVPMRRRATKVWAELANPALYCGYTDGFTRGLADAATDDLQARNGALQRALAADPFAEERCPAGGEIPADATAADAIAQCGLDDPPLGWHDDIDAATYLATRAVRLRLEAKNLHRGDRKILLSILTLSTALVQGQ